LTAETINCSLCDEVATTAVRGTVAKGYVNFCSFHAGAIQMILEKLDVSNSVKWKPLVVITPEKGGG